MFAVLDQLLKAALSAHPLCHCVMAVWHALRPNRCKTQSQTDSYQAKSTVPIVNLMMHTVAEYFLDARGLWELGERIHVFFKDGCY